jgi:hypothetical protein
MWKDVWYVAATWQKLRLIMDWWLSSTVSYLSLLPLLVSERTQCRFKGPSFLLAPFQVRLYMLKPQIVEVFRDRHVNKPQSSMYLISIQEQVGWCCFVPISFGLPADELICVQAMSDLVCAEQTTLHDCHSACDQLDVGNRFS